MQSFPVHTIESAPEKSKPSLEALQSAFGMIPNIAGAMSTSPVLISSLVALFSKVHGGSFTEEQVQILLLTNAVTNSCTWAVAFHTFLSLKEGVDPSDVQAIRERRVPRNPQNAALSTLARTLIEKRGHLEDQDANKFLEVWWIRGNHDTDSDADYDNLFGSTLAGRNLHGRVLEVAGTRIAGLGGIFRGQIWDAPDKPLFASKEDFLARCGKGNRWRGGMPRKHRSTIFPDDYQALMNERTDILVTHEAPSCHRHGFREIDDLARGLKVKTAFHGHHHEQIDYGQKEVERLGFTPYGVGYCGIRDQFGRIVLIENGSK